jgi:type IV secretory pathway TraG/TraD family ATPase VirD4
MIAGGVAWLMADRPPQERRLSMLFDLFTNDDVAYSLAVMLDKQEVLNQAAKSAFTGFLQLSERETRLSVLGTVQSHLKLFDSDLTRRAYRHHQRRAGVLARRTGHVHSWSHKRACLLHRDLGE